MKRLFLIAAAALGLALPVRAELFDDVKVSYAVGKNTVSQETVNAFFLRTPLSDNLGFGAVLANDGGRWLAGGATVDIGGKADLPGIGEIYATAGDGIVCDMLNHRPANYFFTAVGKEWKLDKHLRLSTSVVTANISDRAGIDLMGSVGLKWTF